MRLDRTDAIIALLLLVHGRLTVYRLAGLLVESGAVRLPPSGFKSVERSLASRLKKLESMGFVRKIDSEYEITERVIVDWLSMTGRYTGFTHELGWSVIFDTDNGHYVVFEVDAVLEDLSDETIQKLFSGTPIYTTLPKLLQEAR